MTVTPGSERFLGLFTMNGRIAVPCDNVEEWGRWYATADRTVAVTQVGPISVSTVFIGVDGIFAAGFRPEPLLFETMIFDEGDDDYQTRCSTWEEAEQMHVAAEVVATARVAAAKAGVAPFFATVIAPER